MSRTPTLLLASSALAGLILPVAALTTASAATGTPAAPAACDSAAQPAVSVAWSGPSTATVRLTGTLPPCNDVTLFLSAYRIPDTWDGGIDATLWPQTFLSSAEPIVFRAGQLSGPVTRTVSLPPACVNVQTDVYWAPEVTGTLRNGHPGHQHVSSRFQRSNGPCTTTPTPTPTPSDTVTPTPTPTPTPSDTVTPTPTPSETGPTPTPTPSVTGPTPTPTPSVTGPTPTPTPSVTGPTPTPSVSATVTPTPTGTPTPTVPGSPAPSGTGVPTPAVTGSVPPAPGQVATPSVSPSVLPSVTSSPTPSSSVAPGEVGTPTPAATETGGGVAPGSVATPGSDASVAPETVEQSPGLAHTGGAAGILLTLAAGLIALAGICFTAAARRR